MSAASLGPGTDAALAGKRDTLQPSVKVRPVTRIRQAKGWSKMRLAGVAGVSLDQVNAIERGDVASMTVAKLARIAAALDCRPIDIVPGLGFHGQIAHERVRNLADALSSADTQPPGNRPPPGKVLACMRWLRAELAQGPLLGREVHERAARAGHTRNSVQRAYQRLAIQRVLPAHGGPVLWQLSPEESSVQASIAADATRVPALAAPGA